MSKTANPSERLGPGPEDLRSPEAEAASGDQRDTGLVGAEFGVQSVRRAARILRSFTRETPELGVSEISRQLGYHKSTVSRLLTALRQEGLVVQSTITGKYRLGLAIAGLAGVYFETVDLAASAEPAMQALASETQETVSLFVVERRSCVALYSVSSPHIIRAVYETGQPIPLETSAAGQIVAAFGVPADDRGAILDYAARAQSESSPQGSSSPPLTSEDPLARVRQNHYAVVQEGGPSDLMEIAAPIWDHRGRLRAILALSGPARRLSQLGIAHLADSVTRAAHLVSEAIGAPKR